jgi:hypothetical protein
MQAKSHHNQQRIILARGLALAQRGPTRPRRKEFTRNQQRQQEGRKVGVCLARQKVQRRREDGDGEVQGSGEGADGVDAREEG